MATYYDLLGGENDSFYVKFDTPSPRPHFIVLPKDAFSIQHDFSQMTQGQRQMLMVAVQSTMSRFGIPRGTLSIHRGSWLSNDTKIFHAHICVDVEDYLRVFEQEKNIIPNWPNKKYVTSEWKANKDPSSYPENVRDYPHDQNSYFDVEVAAIESGPEPTEPNLPNVDVQGISVIRHPSHPKIGFVGERNEIPLQNLVWGIESFAQNLGLTISTSNDDNNGCHVCLHLGSVPTGDWNFVSETGAEVLGYITTTGPRFYQLCPLEQRQQWFTAFKESQFACLT